jgi:putative ABC transport system permease protein
MLQYLWNDVLGQHPRIAFAAVVLVGLLIVAVSNRKQSSFIFRSLSRNKLRSGLTGIAVIVLVLVVTGIWTVLGFIDQITEEKSHDLKAIITEKWQVPSQMPYSYAPRLAEGAASRPGDIRPDDSMMWSFYGGTVDGAKLTRESIVFFFCMDPRKVRPMMDDLQDFDKENVLVPQMLNNKRAVVLGRERLKAINKRVGERFTLVSMNYKEIDLEFEIIGEFPDGRYNQSGLMNMDYLVSALDAYKIKHHGTPHPLADKCLNLGWVRVPDSEAFRRIAEQIESSSEFRNPAVKCETASSAIGSWIDAYKDLLFGMRYLLVPAVLGTMSLVIANAISISVRERTKELAVLKVLGFTPSHVLILVLGEALLIGAGSGMISSWSMFFLLNNVMGGVKFPIAFFPAFMIPMDALWWGPVIGGTTAFIGSIMPAWNASRVNVTEVFSRVA